MNAYVREILSRPPGTVKLKTKKEKAKESAAKGAKTKEWQRINKICTIHNFLVKRPCKCGQCKRCHRNLYAATVRAGKYYSFSWLYEKPFLTVFQCNLKSRYRI